MKYLICSLLITSLLFAESYIYVGHGDDGKLIAGVLNRIYVLYPEKSTYIESDIRSEGIELLNIDNKSYFNPKIVIYNFKVQYYDFFYKHSCKHVLDKINTNPENIDIIGIQLKI